MPKNEQYYEFVKEGVDKGLSATDIAQSLQINVNAVRRIASKLGLSFRATKNPKVVLTPQDKNDIVTKYENGRSASSIAVDYGVNTGRITKILRELGVCLRDVSKGKNHPQWSGGRGLKQGRWAVYAPDHPRAMNNGRVWEHVIIMEKVLGRDIHPSEPIHHIDIDPLNNDVDNLYVCESNKEHRNIHIQLEKLTKELLNKGVIAFDRDKGGYYVTGKSS